MAENSMYLKPEKKAFTTFLYNSEKGEFLGRTGTSWLKIGVFYVIFYACLAAFFAALMAVFYQTLDTETNPTYVYGSSILANPALGFRPRPRKENVESTLIWYESGNEKDIKHWTDELDKFIAGYEGQNWEGQHLRDCDFDTYKEDKENDRLGIPRPNLSCKFEDRLLFIDGDKTSLCHKEEKWGYNRDSPCMIIKMNRIIGWEPEVYTDIRQLPKNMPTDLREHITSYANTTEGILPMVWLSCEGENPADKEYLPTNRMLPYRGFPAYYFPYFKTGDGYLSPLVAVQFMAPQPNVLINIECRIWAQNIDHDSQNRLGMVHFELLRD